MNDLLNCANCRQILESPILLPCSHTICRFHETQAIENESFKVECGECNTSHEINPKFRFPSIPIVETLLKRGLHRLDFGSEHNEAKKSCKEFEDLINEFQRFKNDSSFEINRKICELKNKIDLKREEMKNRIDDEALKLIKQLDEYESVCQKQIDHESLKKLDESLNKYATKCKSWKNDLDLLVIDTETWKSIHSNCDFQINMLNKELIEFKSKIFCNELDKDVKRFCHEGNGHLKYNF